MLLFNDCNGYRRVQQTEDRGEERPGELLLCLAQHTAGGEAAGQIRAYAISTVGFFGNQLFFTFHVFFSVGQTEDRGDERPGELLLCLAQHTAGREAEGQIQAYAAISTDLYDGSIGNQFLLNFHVFFFVVIPSGYIPMLIATPHIIGCRGLYRATFQS